MPGSDASGAQTPTKRRPKNQTNRSHSSNQFLQVSDRDTGSDSPGTSPPSSTQGHRKPHKHTVHTHGHKLHARVPSSRGLTGKGKSHSRIGLERRQTHPATELLSVDAADGARDREAGNMSPMKRVGSEPRLASHGDGNGSAVGLAGGQHARKASTAGLRKNRSHTEVRKVKVHHAGTALRKSASHIAVNHARNQDGRKEKEKEKEHAKSNVRFDLGTDEDDTPQLEGEEDADGWTEASGSASPNLSRSGSVSARAASAQQSAAPSLSASPTKTRGEPGIQVSYIAHGPSAPQHPPKKSTPDPHEITHRLLQRVPSHSAAPSLSTVSATATTSAAGASGSGSGGNAMSSSAGTPSGRGTPHTDSAGAKSELMSRFRGAGSATPGDSSPFLHAHPAPTLTTHPVSATSTPPTQLQKDKATRAPADPQGIDARRAKSMGNLAAKRSGASDPANNPDSDSHDGSSFAPRSRKSSAHSAYIPPQASRTQQKLWLQRASSDVEPQPPLGLVGGAGALQVGLGLAGFSSGTGFPPGYGGYGAVTPLVGALGGGFDGGMGGTGAGVDPRIKVQLERTGLEFLVVRRYQDPVGRAVRRLAHVPGGEKLRRIPGAGGRGGKAGKGGLGLSQSLKEGRARNGILGGGRADAAPSRNSRDGTATGRNSFETDGERRANTGGFNSAVGSVGSGNGDDGEDGLAGLLRALWERPVEGVSNE